MTLARTHAVPRSSRVVVSSVMPEHKVYRFLVNHHPDRPDTLVQGLFPAVLAVLPLAGVWAVLLLWWAPVALAVFGVAVLLRARLPHWLWGQFKEAVHRPPVK